MGGPEDAGKRRPSRPKRARGEGSVWQDQKTGKWWYAISENGKQRKFRAPDKPTANARLKELLRQRDQGIAAGAGRITVQQHLQIWMDTVVINLKVKTQRFYRQIAELYLIPYLGRIRLERLSPEDVIAMLNAMRRANYAEQTIDHVYTVGKTALGYAVKWRKIPYNPFDMVDAPQVTREMIEPLTEDEAAALLQAVSDHRLRVLYVIALTLGLRKGELLGLRWEDLNLNEATISITQQVLDLDGQVVIGSPKSKYSRRTLPLTLRLVELVRERAAQVKAERERTDWQEHGLIFPSEVGTPMSQRNLDRQFKAALRKAGVRDIKFHHLRHTCGSWLGDSGTNTVVIKAILGHGPSDVTEEYVHVSLAAMREAIERMEQIKLVRREA